MNKILRWAIVAAMLSATAAGYAEENKDWANHNRYRNDNKELGEPKEGEHRLVFLGNSITDGWAWLVPQFFKEHGYTGRSISGQTSYQMLCRFRQDVIDLKPEIVVINSGTNDCAENTHPFDIETTFGNIKSMTELAEANGIKVILSSVLPAASFRWRPSVTDAPERIAALNKKIKDYAAEKRIPYADYFSALVASDGKSLPKELSEDGVHPTLKGYDIMAGVIVPIIEQVKSQGYGNPVFQGWYADPEGVVIDGRYWIYPTLSQPYDEQTYMDAFSSDDLMTWQKHPRVLSKENVKWLRRALWAPAVVEANGRYYLFFGANDIQSDKEKGGIGVAVADKPEGPFKDALGKPLIGKFVNGAQPIDQYVFRDDNGEYYMYYGGWGHCNMVRLAPDLLSLRPFDDGEMYKEVTPQGYTEGPFMLKRNGKYYFMWSEGAWTGPDYCVAYAIADSPFGPFRREGTVLRRDNRHGTGAGHHSVVKGRGDDEWYIVYHRHPIGATDGNNRVVCVDRLNFDSEGHILPVKMTSGPR